MVCLCCVLREPRAEDADVLLRCKVTQPLVFSANICLVSLLPGAGPSAGGTEATGTPSLPLSCSQTGSGDLEPWIPWQGLVQAEPRACRAEEGVPGGGEQAGFRRGIERQGERVEGGGELSRREQLVHIHSRL